MANRNFNYNLTMPAFTAASFITTYNTIPNLTFTDVTMGSLLTSNANLGMNNLFSASFSASNNVSSATNVTGLTFANASVRSFTATVNTSIIVSSGSSLYAVYTLTGIQNATGWYLLSENVGDTVGITFSITSAGQVQYTSTNISNFTSSTFRYSVNQCNLLGTYTSLLSNTAGSYTINSIQINNTTDSVPGVSNGGINVLGGATISKTLNVTTSVSSGAAFASNSTVTNVVATATSSGSIVTSTIAASTSISTASLSANNTTIPNIIATGISCGTILASSYTGGSLSLSGNLSIGGTLTTTNITTTNVTDTNISTGTLNATSLITSTSFVAQGTFNTLGSIITNSSSGSIGINKSPNTNMRLDINGGWVTGLSGIDDGGSNCLSITLNDTELGSYNHMAFLRSGQSGVFLKLATNNHFYVINGSGGVIHPPGQAYWAANSDRRLKKNIQNLEYGIDQIIALNPVRFDYKTDTTDDSSRIGFIAQEVLPIVKESVSGSEDTNYGLSMTELIPVLVNAIKDLKVVVSNNDAELERLLQI